MRIPTLLIIIATSIFSFGQKKQVCFSIDDLPIVHYGMTDTCFQKNLFNKLASSLNKNGIPAIGFVNEKKLYKNDTLIHHQYKLLEEWINCGLELGNHTYSHPDYNKVSFKKYSLDILKGEIITKALLSQKNQKIKYFRHPFLHVGNNKTKADSLSDFLEKQGYIEAPVTIDNEDYFFAVAYKRAYVKKDTDLMLKIGQDYVNYMEKKVQYFENQSNKLFGRNIAQILLLHASLLNSNYIDSLAMMLQKNNYEFASMDQVLEDKAYNSKVTVYGNWGISWMDRWALSRGKKGVFFKDDPSTPLYIKELAKVRKR